jgi:hypothetical protein
VLFDIVFFLRLACVIQVSKTDAINVLTDIDETNDIETNHPTDEITTEREALTPARPAAQTKDMSDTQSSVSSVMDQERRPSSQLYSVVGILLFYILFWLCGAIAVAEPFRHARRKKNTISNSTNKATGP